MRENTGQDDADSNLRDPTVKDHADRGGHRAAEPAPDEATPDSDAPRDEKCSPSERERGATTGDDEGLPVDIGDGS